MMENASPLPLWLADFVALRKAGRIYVDKTEPIAKLARIEGGFFLARPRRFGKSVLISTLETLFWDGLEHFQGLYIEKAWKDKTSCVRESKCTTPRGAVIWKWLQTTVIGCLS